MEIVEVSLPLSITQSSVGLNTVVPMVFPAFTVISDIWQNQNLHQQYQNRYW
jgi:hypothetical protein